MKVNAKSSFDCCSLLRSGSDRSDGSRPISCTSSKIDKVERTHAMRVAFVHSPTFTLFSVFFSCTTIQPCNILHCGRVENSLCAHLDLFQSLCPSRRARPTVSPHDERPRRTDYASSAADGNEQRVFKTNDPIINRFNGSLRALAV